MIIRAKVVQTICRFKDDDGEGIRIKLRIGRRLVNAVAYSKDFPCGLLASGAVLDGAKIDVQPSIDIDEEQKDLYQVVGWSNQNDSIKHFVMSALVNGMSNAYLENIPWEAEQAELILENDLVRKKLEEIFNLKENTEEDNDEDIPF